MTCRVDRSLARVALLLAMSTGGWDRAAAADLAEFGVVDGAIPESLTDTPGNPARGREIVRDINRATCLICHALPIPEEPDHGSIGPDLQGVGSRYTAGELRLRVVNPQLVNPDTLMPAYHRVDDLYRVSGEYRGEPIYTAQQVEDVVAYLSGLKQ